MTSATGTEALLLACQALSSTRPAARNARLSASWPLERKLEVLEVVGGCTDKGMGEVDPVPPQHDDPELGGLLEAAHLEAQLGESDLEHVHGRPPGRHDRQAATGVGRDLGEHLAEGGGEAVADRQRIRQ